MTRVRSNVGHDGTIINGIGRIGWMAGGKAARWKDEMMARDFSSKACQFIERNPKNPFFLYFATHEPHVPRWPDDRFRGKNAAGIRVESLEEMDWCVGEVMKTLDRLGIADNTLVIVTSDNGPAVSDGYADGAQRDEAKAGHKAAGQFRGGKYTPFEGGVRMPFVARWPARIKPGTVSSEIICLTDMLATMAALVDRPLGPRDGVDSINFLSALTGEWKSARPDLIVMGGSRPSGIIFGDWKLLGSELYDLKDDPSESRNVAQQHPDIVRELNAKFSAQKAAGFIRTGAERLRQPRGTEKKSASPVDESDS